MSYTNLSERDSIVDPAALVAAVDDIGANTFLVNMSDLHQRRLLSPPRADDPHRGARSLRRRRPVLQHVRQPDRRLQRRGDGPVHVRCVPRALPGPPDARFRHWRGRRLRA